MADIVKSTDELKIEFGFYDNDTRTVTLDNPKDDLTKDDILEVANYAIENEPIIGDKGGARVVGINSAKIFKKTVYQLDISSGS